MTIKIIGGSQFPKVVIPLIESAKIRIDIIVFDWRTYFSDPGNTVSQFNQAILSAKKRGVIVRAVVNHEDILKFLKDNNCLAKRLKMKTLIHAKLMIIDNKISILGSHNFTNAGFSSNFELSALIEDEETAKVCARYFEGLWA